MKHLMNLCLFALLCWGCEEDRPVQNIPAISAVITDIAENTAGCSITINMVGATQKVSVIYGTDPLLQSGTQEVSSTNLSGEAIVLNLTGLNDNETYYYKAYIMDKLGGSIYSDIGQFKTKLLLFANASASKIGATYLAGNYTFNIISNTTWSISSNQTWCTIQPASGTGNKEITVSVTENTSKTATRTATLTITVGSQSKQVTVEQDIDGSEFGNGITAAAYGGGDGSQGAPYLINNARQLKKLVDDVNIVQRNYSGTYFKLATDIEVTADEWIPIGYMSGGYSMYFGGIFDGDGHTISGTMKSDKYPLFGFFGNIPGAEISNLIIAATVISEGYFNDVYDAKLTGGIAGASWRSCTIRNCHLTGAVTGGNSDRICSTGGIAGQILGMIQDCTVSGSVTGGSAGTDYTYVTGGVVGGVSPLSTITNCMMSGRLAKGREIGGIVGSNLGLVTNCTVSSEATFSDDSGYIGGIAGTNGGNISNCTNHVTLIGLHCGGLTAWNRGEIHTSLNTGNVSGGIWVGGLVGYNWDNDIIGHVYSCNTNHGSVNGQAANTSNQIGNGNPVEPCPDNHTKR